MMDQMINASAKIFELLTSHLHYCNDNECCVRELADQLFDDKDSSVDVPGPHSAKEQPTTASHGVNLRNE